ncbi:MAG: DUF58 domain-containing protein [Anaerolineales bacterium]|nr:DUF58 domain-containing protein [Anaerolineales bacterium]
MSRRTVVFILAILAFLSGLLTGRDLLFYASYFLGLTILVSFAWAWANMRYVNLSRLTRTRRTQVGRPLEERFRIENTSFVPKLWIEVRDFSNVPAHYASYVVNGMWSHARHSWRVTTMCQKRGRYQLGPMMLRTSDPFGLFTMERELDATTNVVVFPLTFEITNFVLPIGILPGGDALRRRTHYITTNASGVRDYAPGDSFSRIHWPTSARRDRLVVKEFELDPLADIWIVPDMALYDHVEDSTVEEGYSLNRLDIPKWMKREEFTLPPTTEEYTVTVAASLAQYFLRLDRSVGMMAYGQVTEIVQPDRGERQLNRLLETLSVLRAEGKVYIENVLQAEAHLFPRGTTVIIVTPTTRPQWASAARQLKQRGLRVVTVLVNPASFGSTSKSAEQLYALLQASGTGAYMVNEGDDLTAALSGGHGMRL